MQEQPGALGERGHVGGGGGVSGDGDRSVGGVEPECKSRCHRRVFHQDGGDGDVGVPEDNERVHRGGRVVIGVVADALRDLDVRGGEETVRGGPEGIDDPVVEVGGVGVHQGGEGFPDPGGGGFRGDVFGHAVGAGGERREHAAVAGADDGNRIAEACAQFVEAEQGNTGEVDGVVRVEVGDEDAAQVLEIEAGLVDAPADAVAAVHQVEAAIHHHGRGDAAPRVFVAAGPPAGSAGGAQGNDVAGSPAGSGAFGWC